MIKLNSEYLNEMLTIKIVHTTFVIVLFWKGPNRISNTKYKVVSLGDFKNIIKSWNGPSCKCPNILLWSILCKTVGLPSSTGESERTARRQFHSPTLSCFRGRLCEVAAGRGPLKQSR